MSDKRNISFHYWEAKSEVVSKRTKHRLTYAIYWLGSPDQEWATKAKETYLSISNKYNTPSGRKNDQA